MYYATSTGGFYSLDIHGAGMPADAVEIGDDRYVELLDGQSAGLAIEGGTDGYPVLITLPSVPMTADQIERRRLAAYADPIAGSDRYFSEVMRLNSMGGTAEEIAIARAAGESRYAEIKAEYPWP